MKITIIGWNMKDQAVAEVVTDWPDEMSALVAIARASREADVHVVEDVLVERMSLGSTANTVAT